MEKTELKIHIWPQKLLRKKCKRVRVVDGKINRLLDEMRSLMIKNKGVGLAANQIGLDLSLVVGQFEGRIFKLVNPRIVKRKGEINFSEGCLSFPGLELKIKRAQKLWIWAWDERGEPRNYEAEGILAVIFQHEIDHINGILFIDKIPFWQRLRIRSKLKEIAAGKDRLSE